MKRVVFILSLLISITSLNADNQKTNNKSDIELERAKSTLDSLYKYYSTPKSKLLRENYPFDAEFIASYLATQPDKKEPNKYAYLWPFSGTFSALTGIMHTENTTTTKKLLDKTVLVGLEEYFDTKRPPAAYASYINGAPESDRFYDDNVWLGIDFCDAYALTKDKKYLKKAQFIWKFIESGMDEKLRGGIYWCEQKKESKNTCSNAPGAVYALKLYLATNNNNYLKQGTFLYEWTQKNLQDPTDYLYFDNLNLKGEIGRAKYAYNSGQMIQAATLLYTITKDEKYLKDAQNVASACHDYFFHDFKSPDRKSFRLLNKGNIWFTAVMQRGYVELYNVDKNSKYMDDFRKSLDYAWTHSRDAKGLFEEDWSGVDKREKKWLLTQAAMVEMYARMATIK